MLSLMRKHAQSWLIKAALFIIAIVFVFWGVGSFRSDRASKVAQVNGKTITVAEYQQAYRQMTDRMRSLYGQQLDDKTLYTPEFKRKILDGIIEKKLLLDLGRTLGFQAYSGRGFPVHTADGGVPGKWKIQFLSLQKDPGDEPDYPPGI